MSQTYYDQFSHSRCLFQTLIFAASKYCLYWSLPELNLLMRLVSLLKRKDNSTATVLPGRISSTYKPMITLLPTSEHLAFVSTGVYHVFAASDGPTWLPQDWCLLKQPDP